MSRIRFALLIRSFWAAAALPTRAGLPKTWFVHNHLLGCCHSHLTAAVTRRGSTSGCTLWGAECVLALLRSQVAPRRDGPQRRTGGLRRALRAGGVSTLGWVVESAGWVPRTRFVCPGVWPAAAATACPACLPARLPACPACLFLYCPSCLSPCLPACLPAAPRPPRLRLLPSLAATVTACPSRGSTPATLAATSPSFPWRDMERTPTCTSTAWATCRSRCREAQPRPALSGEVDAAAFAGQAEACAEACTGRLGMRAGWCCCCHSRCRRWQPPPGLRPVGSCGGRRTLPAAQLARRCAKFSL